MEDKLLLYLLLLPLLGALATLLLSSCPRWSKGFALLCSSLLFFLSLPLLYTTHTFSPSHPLASFQAVNTTITIAFGIDGVSAWLLFLITFLLFPCLVSLLSSESFSTIATYLFLLVFALVGVFTATDLLLFYLFWELSLLPLLFLIGLYGSGQKIYVAFKFFLYTFAGSIFLLAGILYALFVIQVPSLQWHQLLQLRFALGVQSLLTLLFAAGFVVKIPLFPFHTWLPDAHTEAPTVGSVFLAGVLLKMGVYGFLRWILPLFPDGMSVLSPYLIGLAVTGAIYTGIVCTVQPDIKRLIAYSSVAHLSLVVLGFASGNKLGIEGALLQTINHGISTGGLFLLIGVIYERRHTRLLSEFGGLALSMPRYSAFFLIVALSSLGLPGLNGFPGELLIFLGAFARTKIVALAALFSLFLSALYLLTAVKKMFHGPLVKEENRSLNDLNTKEWLMLVPILLLIFLFGIFPQLLLNSFHSYLGSLRL